MSEINPRTYKVIRTFAVGGQPNHITPSWDGSVLWVNNTDDYSLTPISPRTGQPGRPVPVADGAETESSAPSDGPSGYADPSGDVQHEFSGVE